MASIIILALIIGYSAVVIWKKCRDLRRGKFCGGCKGECRKCGRSDRAD